MLNSENKCVDFLFENKLNFEQMIRAFNFWSSLKIDERDELINSYANGNFNGIGGWY